MMCHVVVRRLKAQETAAFGSRSAHWEGIDNGEQLKDRRSRCVPDDQRDQDESE
jgi:hypothetical protein